jgi:acetylglutamate synthase
MENYKLSLKEKKDEKRICTNIIKEISHIIKGMNLLGSQSQILISTYPTISKMCINACS